MVNDVTVFNIREYLSAKDEAILGEEALQQILSEFSCEKNSDVEIKERIKHYAGRTEIFCRHSGCGREQRNVQ